MYDEEYNHPSLYIIGVSAGKFQLNPISHFHSFKLILHKGYNVYAAKANLVI